MTSPSSHLCTLLALSLAAAAAAAQPASTALEPDTAAGALDILTAAPADVPGAPDNGFLAPDDAFRLSATAPARDSVVIHWQLADTYYLYRKSLRVGVPAGSEARLGTPRLPSATARHDPYFGDVEVYLHALSIEVPVLRPPPAGTPLALEVGYQGCTERGLCYPPLTRTLQVVLPAGR